MQESFNILIELFEWIGLFTNANKTKAIACIPVRIREGKTDKEYAEYKSQTKTTDGKRCQVDCEFCGASLAAGSYQSHLELQHNIFWSFVPQRDVGVDRPAVIYCAIKSIAVDTRALSL